MYESLMNIALLSPPWYFAWLLKTCSSRWTCIQRWEITLSFDAQQLSRWVYMHGSAANQNWFQAARRWGSKRRWIYYFFEYHRSDTNQLSWLRKYCFFSLKNTQQEKWLVDRRNKYIWSKNLWLWPRLNNVHRQHKARLKLWDFYGSEVEVEGNPKAPFSIATTPRCWGRCYSFPWIALLYPWYVPYNAEC